MKFSWLHLAEAVNTLRASVMQLGMQILAVSEDLYKARPYMEATSRTGSAAVGVRSKGPNAVDEPETRARWGWVRAASGFGSWMRLGTDSWKSADHEWATIEPC